MVDREQAHAVARERGDLGEEDRAVEPGPAVQQHERAPRALLAHVQLDVADVHSHARRRYRNYDRGVSEASVPQLLQLLEQSSAGLGDVEVTRAHGCEAIAAAGRPYALVAPDGRIGVRLPDWDLFAAAYELPGSDVALRERPARRPLGACCRPR